jgi:hypothetical protein
VPTQRPFVPQCSLVDSSLFGAEGLSTKDKRTSSIDRRVALGSGFAKVAKSGGTGIPIATKQVAIQEEAFEAVNSNASVAPHLQ